MEDMGNPQTKTTVKTDNSAAQVLITKIMIPTAAKSYEMRFNFLKFCAAQRKFDFVWRRRRNDRADYHSKRYPIGHHIDKQKAFVVDIPLRKN